MHSTSGAAAFVRTTALLTCGVLAFAASGRPTDAQSRGAATKPATPIDDKTLWLVPPTGSTNGAPALAVAVEQIAEDKAAYAIPALTKAATDPVIGLYARVHLGRAYLATGRTSLAEEMADQVLGTRPTGYLADAALRLAADAAEARLDWAKVLTSLRALSLLNPVAPEQVHLRIAQIARELGDLPAAHSAFSKVYYEYPLTPEANAAADALTRLSRSTPPEKAALDLSRAHRFFGARRYADARKAYEPLRSSAEGDERQLIELRLAACDVYLKRYPQAREALKAHVDRPGPLQSEAQVLLPDDHPRAGPRGRIPLARPHVRRHVSRSRPRRADAERARHVLHPEERRRPGRGILHGARAPLSARHVRGPRQLESRLVGLQERQLRRDDSPVRIRGGDVAPRRLPAVVALLGGPLPRRARRFRRRLRGLSAGHRGLPQFLLRPGSGAGDRLAAG